MKGMYKEGRRITQGCRQQGTDRYAKDTNTVLVKDLEKNQDHSERPSGNVCTNCGRLSPQEKYANCVRITLGGNLIKCPF